MAGRKDDPFHVAMPDGESLLLTRLRSRVLLERCARERSGQDVLVVTHGEFIEALWSELAHMSTEEHREFFQAAEHDIQNCQVVEFAAEDPGTGEWLGKFRWVRSSCPHAGCFGIWSKFERRRFSPSQLLEIAEQCPPLGLDPRGLADGGSGE